MSDRRRHRAAGVVAWALGAAGVVSGLLAAGGLGGCMTVYKPALVPAAHAVDRAALDAGDGLPAGVAGPSIPAPPDGAAPSWGDEAWAKEAAWPERVRVWSGLRWETLRETGIRPRGIVERLDGPLQPMSRGDAAAKRLERELVEDIGTLTSRWRRRWSERSVVTVSGEGPGAFVFLGGRGAAGGGGEGESTNRPAFHLKFLSGTEFPAAPGGPGPVIKVQRTWFAFYEPLAGATSAGGPAGVAVVLPGMFGTPKNVVDGLVTRLRSRGWAVLRMLAHPSRFTEKQVLTVGPGPLDGPAAEIASVLTDRAAECAYAVQAANLYLWQEYPLLRQRPRVLVGMSGGALVLPTVMAREPKAYAGAVLVAGGVDYLQVALTSNYAAWIDAVSVKFDPPRPSSERVTALRRAYLEKALLDPAATARVLAGKPVLMVHASEDKAVPAELGDELWTIAGKPERWVFGVGHELLFLALPWHLDRMAEWIDRGFAAPAAKPGAGAAAPVATKGPA